jgi:hypothetical protein
MAIQYLTGINVSGNVGIGTTRPSAKLDVVGNVNTDNSISIQGLDTGNPSASSEELRLSGYGVLGNRSAMYITNGHATGTMRFGVGGSGGNHGSNTKMVLNSSGNLGIGTTSPGSLLHVEGSRTTAALQVNQTGTGVIANFKQGGNSKVLIDNSGKVGIGTDSPLEKLHVEGNLELQSNFQISSNSGNYWQRIRTVDDSASTTNAFNFETRNGSGAYLQHMVIRNDGNVGIGTTSPSANLEVSGASAVLRIGPRYTSGGDRDFIDLIANGSDTKILSNNERFHIENNSGNIIINPSGSVGIGTTSPSSKLQVTGSTQSTDFKVGSSGTMQLFDYSGNLHIYSTAGTDILLGGGIGGRQNDVTIGNGNLTVNGSAKVANDSDAASAGKAGALRYRVSGNNSYVDMCMRTGATTYAWVNIVQNNW